MEQWTISFIQCKVSQNLRLLNGSKYIYYPSTGFVCVLVQLLFLSTPLPVISQEVLQKIPSIVEPPRPDELQKSLSTKPKPEPKSEIYESEKSESLHQIAPLGAEKIKIENFKRIVIDGNTTYMNDQFESFYRDKIGAETSLADIYKIAAEIQKKYRADGYKLTRVVVPAQEVKKGCVILRVVQGYINNVRVEGNADRLQERVEEYLNSLKGIEPVNERELERYLLLVNDLPGVSARGVLRPGKVEVKTKDSSDKGRMSCDTFKHSQDSAGASELVVRVEREYFDGDVIINNRGSRFSGPWRSTLVANANSPLGYGERLQLIFLTAFEGDEQRFFSLSYRQPIGSDGLTFNLSASYGPSKPGFTLEPLDLETETLNLNTSFNYPLIRARHKNWFVGFGFEATNTDIDTLGESLSRDRLRVFYASTNYNVTDNMGGETQVGFSVRQGLSVLGASSNNSNKLSRLEGRSDFTALQLFGSRLQNLIENTNLYIALKGQYAFNPLLSVEEFRLGGEQFGRGYDSSELAGDHGLAINTELQHTIRTPFKVLPVFQVYGFYDFGVVWNRDRGVDPRQSLSSAGAGIRSQIFDNFTIGVEVAKPLTRIVATEGSTDPRAFFQVSARF